MSLRLRLVLGMALVSAVLIGTAFAITRTTEGHLVRQVDNQLRSAVVSSHDFGYDGEPGGGHGGPGVDNHPPPAPARVAVSSLYVGAVSGGRVTTLQESNLGAKALPKPTLSASQLAVGDGEVRVFTAGTSGSSLRYRVLVSNDPGRGYPLLLGLPLNAVDAAVSRLVQLELLVSGLVLALLALVTFWVLRLGVRPIKQMTRTATAIAGGDLSQRVPAGNAHTEAGELGVALNGMLVRIEEAFDERTRSEARLRRFVADASHELRTPITTIRGYAELYRAGGLDEEAGLADAMRRTEQEAVRMGTLVEDMLLLARLDQGRPLESVPVDLAVLADDATRDAHAVDPARPVASDARGPAVVLGDEGRLRQVVGNLVANALQHTPAGTPVEVRVRSVGDEVVLEVADAGPGMDADVAERIFERFYRADPSRSRHRGGTGLGLSIASAIVAAHGGRIEVQSAVGEGTTVSVRLPRRQMLDSSAGTSAGAGADDAPVSSVAGTGAAAPTVNEVIDSEPYA
ncbi:MAG: ATP-binding protein [Acidimicrobiales bacterium]|nr:ATP-binding protein [Acidimicrobiales bacterium]